jgi:hypothetical protein
VIRSIAHVYSTCQNCTRISGQEEAAKLHIKHHTSFPIGQSISTLGIQTSGVLSPPLLLSPQVFSLRVNRSLPCVLPKSMVVIHFRAPTLHAYHPRALKCQITWKSSVQIGGALINHDTWNPYGDDMCHSVQTPLGISSAFFQVTCVTSLFMKHQHSDVRPSRQIIL